MNILCFGKDGLLSSELQQWLPVLKSNSLIFLSKSDCDISDANAVTQVFDAYQPSIVINSAAYTKVDQCEDEFELANKINGHALQHIVDGCKQFDAMLVHFSTDYVFDGKQETPYSEDDSVHPINAYGQSKLIGEKIIQNQLKRYYILRVQWVFGKAKPNFLTTMLNLAKNKSQLSVVSDQFGSPTSTTSISKAVVNLLQVKPNYGIYHFRTLNHTNWADYARHIFKVAKLDVEVESVTSDQYPTKAKRPKNSVMNTSKWTYQDIYTPKTWQEDVENILAIILTES